MVTIKDIATSQQIRTAGNSYTLKEKDHIVVSASSPSSVPPQCTRQHESMFTLAI